MHGLGNAPGQRTVVGDAHDQATLAGHQRLRMRHESLGKQQFHSFVGATASAARIGWSGAPGTKHRPARVTESRERAKQPKPLWRIEKLPRGGTCAHSDRKSVATGKRWTER